MLEPDYTGMTCNKNNAMRCLNSHHAGEVLDCGDHITVAGEYTCNGTTGIEVAIFRPGEDGRYSIEQLRDYLGY
jgi:hypothetical protein